MRSKIIAHRLLDRQIIVREGAAGGFASLVGREATAPGLARKGWMRPPSPAAMADELFFDN